MKLNFLQVISVMTLVAFTSSAFGQQDYEPQNDESPYGTEAGPDVESSSPDPNLRMDSDPSGTEAGMGGTSEPIPEGLPSVPSLPESA